jgi:hypothetical protein
VQFYRTGTGETRTTPLVTCGRAGILGALAAVFPEIGQLLGCCAGVSMQQSDCAGAPPVRLMWEADPPSRDGFLDSHRDAPVRGGIGRAVPYHFVKEP